MRYAKIKDTYVSWVTRKGLSAHAGFLGVYALSCPHSNLVGCFRLPLAYLVEDLGWPQPQVRKALAELIGVGFLQRDEETGWTRVVGFFDHNPIANSNVGKAAMPYIAAVPPSLPFHAQFIAELRLQGHRFPAGFLDEMANRSGNGMANGSWNGLANGFMQVENPEAEAEAEAEQGQRTERKRATPLPDDWTVTDAMRAWAAAETPTVDVDRENAKFVNNYRGNGKRMKDWLATWRNWMLRAVEFASSRSPARPIGAPPMGSAPLPAVDWDKVCATFKEIGHWSNYAGDRPGLPGCKCPPDVLARHGLTQAKEAA